MSLIRVSALRASNAFLHLDQPLPELPFIKYKSINKAEESQYVDGQLEGMYKKFYDGQDKVQQEIAFKADKQDGEHLFYDEKGVVTMRYTYKNGE